MMIIGAKYRKIKASNSMKVLVNKIDWFDTNNTSSRSSSSYIEESLHYHWNIIQNGIVKLANKII
jgi:hypothetical protein